MDIVELYFSDQEFSVEREREIAEEYERYVAHLDQLADRDEYERIISA